MKDILSEIIEQKRMEVARLKQETSPEQLRQQALEALRLRSDVPRRSMKQALAASASGIIAEFKRRSPSKGWIHRDARPEAIAPAYEAAGASALSILTDEPFFGGSLQDLQTARARVNLPILRKDFVIDEYQLMQACVAGADAVLLIAACLTPDACAALTTQAHAWGLEVLLEVHAPQELAYVTGEADMVGINNRNLGSFVTDVENSFRMAGQLRNRTEQVGHAGNAPLLVSESGLSQPETVRSLRAAGFRGFLMGENFMKTGQPGDTLRAFIANI